MKGRPVDQLVYEYMIPRPKATDPRNFREILTRHLVYEVRQEVYAFYGHLDTQEAKYPGLDYCHPVHRIRLGRLPWHRRLFRAFDAIGLTAAEIASLTKWEGTKWAKDRFEKEQGIIIRDTAADDMPDYRTPGRRWLTPAQAKVESVPPQHSVPQCFQFPRESRFGAPGEEAETDVPMVDDNTPDFDYSSYASNTNARTMEAGASTATAVATIGGGDESDGEIESIGFQLNQQLRERVAAHNSGDTSLPLDEDWEQWLKSAFESGNMNLVMEHISLLAASPTSPSSSAAAAAVAAVAAATASTEPASTEPASNASSVMATAFAASVAAAANTGSVSASASTSTSSSPGTDIGTDTDTGTDYSTGFNRATEGHLIDLSGDARQAMEMDTSPHRQRRRLRRQNTLPQRVEFPSHGRDLNGTPSSASSFQSTQISPMATAGHHFSGPQRWHRSYSTLRLPAADPPA